MGNQGDNRIKDRDSFVKSDAAKHGKTAAEELAVELLGKVLCRRIYEDGKPFVLRGRIVMTEAYLDGESVTDATNGPTAQLKLGGHLHIKNAQGGLCRCDIVAGEEGSGESVLIRSLDPYGSHPCLSAGSLFLDEKDDKGNYLFDGADLLKHKDIWLEDDGAEVLDVVKGKRENLPEGASQESLDAELKFSVREIRYNV